MYHEVLKIEPWCEKTNNIGFRPGPGINWPVQSLKQTRSLKIWTEEGLYYLCRYCTAGL